MKIALIGNCQARGIERCIRKMAPEIEIDLYHLNRIQRADPVLDPLRQWMTEVHSADAVLCVHPLPDSLSIFSDEAIGRSRGRVVRFPHIATSAYHPDCVYIRNVPDHSDNPMGPYHSIIAAAGFCLGLTAERTEMLYNRYVLKKLGFCDRFEMQIQAFAKLAKGLGYELGPFLSDQESAMHTINHPKIEILLGVARQALAKAGVDFREISASDVHDELEEAIRWPVYPGVVRGIKGSFEFGFKDKDRNLGDFVAAEFLAFQRAGTRPTNRAIESALPILDAILVKGRPRAPG